MRDNYVGDVGDFHKYGLLRHLTKGQKLGVVWYLYPDPCKETDGLHLDYLSEKLRSKFESCDPDLYAKLQKLIKEDARSVHEVAQRAILPADACFYTTPLSFSGQKKGTKAAIEARKKYREQWLEKALDATTGCDLVFFDPDNGLETKSVAMHQDKGAKFTFYHELLPFWQRGQSLVIYQHKNLHQTAAIQIQTRIAELKNWLPDAQVNYVYFPSYGGRIFLLVNTAAFAVPLVLLKRVFMQNWSQHVKIS